MTDIKDYWAQKEAEIGETVDAKFYCTYISGDESAKGPLTGVLFFSRSTLSFQSFYAAKDLKSLFQMHSQKGISGEGHSFKMPLKRFAVFFQPTTAKFMAKAVCGTRANPRYPSHGW